MVSPSLNEPTFAFPKEIPRCSVTCLARTLFEFPVNNMMEDTEKTPGV